MPTKTRPISPGSTSLPSLVHDPHHGAPRRPPGRARRGPQVLRRRDRRPGDLGRPVEVVEVVAEGVHPLGGQLARQRRAARGGHPEVGQVVPVERLLRQLEDPLHHHRHDDQRGRAALLRGAQRLLRVEAAAKHIGRAERQAEHEVGEAPRVEERRGDHRSLSRPQRNLREQRCQRAERVGLCALRPLGRPRRARGQDHEPARLGGGIEVAVVAGLDQVVERAIRRPLVAAVGPGDEAPQPDLLARLRGRLEQAPELAVMDQRHGLLALDHAGQLRCGEGRVHVQARGAKLRDRERRLDEAAVVATHDRDPVSLPHALCGKAPGERVGATVDLGEGQRARLVLEHRLVGMVDRPTGDPGRRRGAPTGQHPEELRQLVRTHRVDHAGLDERPDVEGHLAQGSELPQLDLAADVAHGAGDDVRGQLAGHRAKHQARSLVADAGAPVRRRL